MIRHAGAGLVRSQQNDDHVPSEVQSQTQAPSLTTEHRLRTYIVTDPSGESTVGLGCWC
jgi:hypothetical protein